MPDIQGKKRNGCLPVREIKSNKKKKRKSGLRIIALAVLVLFGVMAVNSYNLHQEKKALEKQYAELTEELQGEEERSVMLEERRAYMQTIRFIEEIAREKLGLVYEDEVIFRPEEEE